jgi:hypothetical protein
MRKAGIYLECLNYENFSKNRKVGKSVQFETQEFR